MAYEIKWTLLAKDNYFETVSYIYDTWGETSAEKFTDNLEASLKNLERFHFIGKPYPLLPSVRQLVLGKHQSLFYTVFENTILILNLIDSRRKI
ncbi:type II toxin-antitoxin system RelE/ParE family toxin [Dyadobacter alkalitolerans]|uniref:type II toxin-antitoxin system RelE/ParE family toxin n=1 Tax=Dyadobacter alkalitolerans TaxID=492736 RepID=UPI00041699E2|nr:type II toxin-antitoxin system RelE/ParE family toxin [Dyadobacter alkalitolerans]